MSWCFVDKAAAPEVKEKLRLASLWTFGPAGTFEQDDADNWQECTNTSKGVVARRHPMNFQMGIGHERFDDDLKAWASDSFASELNHRGLYSRWAQLMAADTWADL